ncbi:MAG: T9SS type A sorting domain-containing protein [FCB group bacterium]|nr:T9SS type A sorting domain-containing protein [FCB group bacterium]MBL7028364.1 T9SS type A sorting domain-containing protein [Candidatus Neomarinimicrobiota bacterium]MBL7121291.1 T9SS type A sorting domain-containing protein [Candidatus Neomarinimicrobiota bacterium]
MNDNSKHRLFLAILLLGTITIGSARDEEIHVLAKPATREFELLASNNISNWIGNQGHLSSHIPTGDSGCEWPAGSGKSTIFASGIWVLGQVDGEIRSAAAEYTSEWTAGTIPYDTQTKQPIDDTPLNTPDHQIYYIQKGNSSDPASEAYNREYATWPVSDGAPAHDGEYFTDLNSNGIWDSGESFEDYDGNDNYDPPDGLLVTGEDPPLFIGETQTWSVMNDWDTTAHNNLWNETPLGLEAQVLIYTRSDDPVYENIQFHTVTLINKSGQPIDQAYYGYWSDNDLGDATDDAGGCDSTLSLSYFYNGNPHDRDYGIRPPALGFDLLQGALVPSPGDTVSYEGVSHADLGTLDMTSFILITKSNIFSDAENVVECYRMMQGLLPSTGLPITDPWGEITTFHVAGDPVTDNGWTALNSYPVGDRRSIMSSGPFDLPPWDDINNNGRADFGEPGVQILHSALIIVDGADHLDAITNLKYVSRYTQSDFDRGFETFSMEAPQLSASSHDQEIILNWYEGAEEYEATAIGNYEFEGYNLYQGSSATGPWTRLATYDVLNEVGVIYDQQYNETGFLESRVVQVGHNSGLEHLISMTSDALNDDAPLMNNKAYYYALSAYAYAEEETPKTISSEKQIVSIRPHLNYGGSAPRDTLTLTQTGNSDIYITVDVRDPGQLTGADYEIGFEYDSSTSLGRWQLLRGSTLSPDTLFRSEWFENLLRDWHWRYGYKESPPIYYFDGFELSVSDISFQEPKYKTHWEQTVNLVETQIETLMLLAIAPGGVDSLAWTDETMTDTVHLDTLYGPDYYYDRFEVTQTFETYFILSRAIQHDVLIQGFASKFGAQGGDRLADIPGIGGGSTNQEFLQSDLELRFTEAGQNASLYSNINAYVPVMVQVPFEIWDIERNIQLCVGINDNNRSGSIQDTTLYDWQHTLDLDWVVVFDRDYEIYGDEADSLFRSPYSGWCWQFNNASKFSIGDVVSIQFLNPVKAGVDVYSWSTEVAGTAYDEDALDMIRVFPNPFFGYQSEQTSFSEPYVTLSNLPDQECTIRIYNLGGSLVRRFDHELGTYEYWDLLNEHGSPVASGVYIIHIEVPDLGNKILKVAVFQPE